MSRHINKLGLEMIKFFEGFSSIPYRCSGGHQTIGFGHKIKPNEELSFITEIQAEELLLKDIKIAEQTVERNITPRINDFQFSALVSFAFNLGGGVLQRSTLRQKINYGASTEEIVNEFPRWVYANGRISQGLVNRRKTEAIVFAI